MKSCAAYVGAVEGEAGGSEPVHVRRVREGMVVGADVLAHVIWAGRGVSEGGKGQGGGGGAPTAKNSTDFAPAGVRRGGT